MSQAADAYEGLRLWLRRAAWRDAADLFVELCPDLPVADARLLGAAMCLIAIHADASDWHRYLGRGAAIDMVVLQLDLELLGKVQHLVPSQLVM